MSKPTNLRLDDTTKARADAIKAASPVPLTTSAVLQEAIRRGLDAIERETARKPATLSDEDIDEYGDCIRKSLTPLLGEYYARVAVPSAHDVMVADPGSERRRMHAAVGRAARGVRGA